MLYPHLQNNFHEIGFLIGSIKSGSYVGIFLLAMLVSFVIPLPEVVILILFGFIAATTKLNLIAVIATAFAGSVLGDNVIYRLSFLGHDWVGKFNEKMRQHKLIKYEHLVVKNIGRTVYFLRLVTGVRFFGPVIAGTLGAKWKKFFWADFGATMLHTIIFILLGYYFHKRIFAIIAEVEIIRNLLLFSSAIIVAFILGVYERWQCEK